MLFTFVLLYHCQTLNKNTHEIYTSIGPRMEDTQTQAFLQCKVHGKFSSTEDLALGCEDLGCHVYDPQ